MNLSKLVATTVLALAIALPTGQVLSQEKQQNVDTNLNQAEQNIDNAGEIIRYKLPYDPQIQNEFLSTIV